MYLTQAIGKYGFLVFEFETEKQVIVEPSFDLINGEVRMLVGKDVVLFRVGHIGMYSESEDRFYPLRIEQTKIGD